MRHVFSCAVRFDDFDPFQHVNNVILLEFLQEARIDFAHRYLTGATAKHEASVVASQSIEYLVPVGRQVASLDVHVWVTRMGTSSFDISYEIRDDTALYARATSALVAFDAHAGAPRPLTSAERSVLDRFLEPA